MSLHSAYNEAAQLDDTKRQSPFSWMSHQVAGNMQIYHKLFSHRATHTHTYKHINTDLQMQTAHTYTKMTALQLTRTHTDECLDETVHAHM